MLQDLRVEEELTPQRSGVGFLIGGRSHCKSKTLPGCVGKREKAKGEERRRERSVEKALSLVVRRTDCRECGRGRETSSGLAGGGRSDPERGEKEKRKGPE